MTDLKLEYLICGSPTDAFFSQIAFFRLCLNRLGRAYRKARLVAVFGDQTEEVIPQRWRPYFKNIEVHWAHEIGAENPNHVLQHNRRFDLISSSADVSFLCDADIAVLRPMDELIFDLINQPKLAGVIAHYHFPWPGRTHDPDRDWSELSESIIGKEIARPFAYTLTPEELGYRAPFYINFGMLAGTPDVLARFHARDMVTRQEVTKHLGDWWAPQVSLPLTCEDLELSTQSLPMRYNFPNDPKANELYPEELKRIVFLHYLRRTHFKREEIFVSESAFQEFLSMPLSGANAEFQCFVKDATAGSFPFPAQKRLERFSWLKPWR